MTIQGAFVAALAAIGLQVAGCSKQSQTPLTSAAPAANPPVAGNDQDSRKTVAVPGIPLVFSIPDDWAAPAPLAQASLHGPGPKGDVSIALSTLDYMDDFRQHLFVSGTIDESQKHPNRVQARQLTSAGGLQVLEKVTYIDMPADPPGQAEPATQPSQRLYWNITIFVPYQNKFIPCNMELANITQEQYLADEPIVESIVETAQQGELPKFQ